MEVTAYKNGGLNGNWLALYACIMNRTLTSGKALAHFGIGKPLESKRMLDVKKKTNIEAMVKDYEAGLSLYLVGRKYGVCTDSARSIITEAGIKIRKKGRQHN